MTSYSKFVQGGNETNRGNGYSSGFDTNVKVSQAAMGHAPDRELWTPGKIDDLVAQWGFAHFFNAGPQQGNALYAQMMEVIMADSPGSTLGIWTPPEPEIFLHAQQFDVDNPPFAFTSCNAWRTTDKRTDPNMRRKVWFFPYFRTEWDETNNGPFDLYWRVIPAYDNSKPGFDGVFNHNELSPYIWTDGELYENIANYSDPDIVRWGNNFYYYQFNDAEMRVMSPSLTYNMCALGDLVDEDGNVTIEAFIRDRYGVDSSNATLVLNLARGDCCGGALMFNKIVPLR